jgi:hypothetical protein
MTNLELLAKLTEAYHAFCEAEQTYHTPAGNYKLPNHAARARIEALHRMNEEAANFMEAKNALNAAPLIGFGFDEDKNEFVLFERAHRS